MAYCDRWGLVVLLGLSPAVGCGGPKASGGDGTETGDSGDGSDTGSGSGPGDGSGTGGPGGGGIPLPIVDAIDVLFVVDDSGSMATAQARLAAAAGVLIDGLDQTGATYRIGVTTTDDGNPWCTTSTEAGVLVGTTCRARMPDFTSPTVDAYQEACLDGCALDDLGLVPTPTDLDPSPQPRPWIQHGGGDSNLPGGVGAAEALACLLPQGVAGCGFERPLEAMYKAIVRANNEGEPNFGFLRADSVLTIVLVSDEVDCSHNPDHDSIFLDAGLKTFWSVPTDSTPTSAVCWNAGVSCTGVSPYDECHSVDLAPDGSTAGDPDTGAVLRPLSRYVDLVQSIEEAKTAFDPSAEVLVAGILGVPEGYGQGAAELVYQDSPDPAAQNSFGIGPGCSSTTVTGLPPVRMREFIENFEVSSDRGIDSVCADDYAPALARIAGAIRDRVRPVCFPACAADLDPTTPAVDASCVVTETAPLPDGSPNTYEIPPCEGDGTVPAGATACYVALAADALSDACDDEGWNLEFRFVRSEPRPAGALTFAECQLSNAPGIDCPGLPG